MTLQKTDLSDVGSYRGVHAHSCIIGNRGKMERNSKICINNNNNNNNLYLTWEKHLAKAILQVFHKSILRKKERNMYIEM